MRNKLWVMAAVSCIAVAALSLPAVGQDWKAKPYSEWTEDDAKQVLTESPWAKSAMPTVVAAGAPLAPPPARRGHHRGLFGGLVGGGNPPVAAANAGAAPSLPKLIVRWESAEPLQEAEHHVHNARTVAVDGNHYVIAVYGVPRALFSPEILSPGSNRDAADEKLKRKQSNALITALKRHVVIKSVGRREIYPASVEVLPGKEDAVVVYTFSKKDEIIWREHKVDFEAQIGNLKVLQTFNTDEMTLHGKLEL